MIDGPPRVGHRSTPFRIAGYLAICAGFAVVSLVSGGLLHLGDRIAGTHPTSVVERASFLRPSVADAGLVPGRSVTVVAVSARGATPSFRASCGVVHLDALQRLAGAGVTHATVFVPSSCDRHWLVVSVDALRHPLTAWVR